MIKQVLYEGPRVKNANPDDAGYDLIATSEPNIVGTKSEHGWSEVQYIEYSTSLKIAPVLGSGPFHTLIFPRSSISKTNLVLANSVGLIDAGYRNEIFVRFKYIAQPFDYIFFADASGALSGVGGVKVNLDRIYKKGDKIAQLVFAETIHPQFFETDLSKNVTSRGLGGFGSSGR